MSGYNSRIDTLNQGHSDKSPRRITGKPHQVINGLRLSDINKIMRHRHGPGPCMDGQVHRYFRAALPHIVGSRIRWLDAVRAWVVEHAPILLIIEGEDWIAEQATECAEKGKGRYPKSDKLAKLLSVTQAEVKTLNLRIIPSATRTKKVRESDRLKADAVQHAQKRASQGATPRKDSKAQTKPWVAEGMNRTDWYAARKAEKEAMSESYKAPDDFVGIITADTVETVIPDDFVGTISVEAPGLFRRHHQLKAEPDIEGGKTISETSDTEADDATLGETAHTIEIDTGDQLVNIRVPMPARAPTVYSETRIRDQIQRLQAVAHIAQAEYAREVPFGASGSWF